MFDDVRRIKMKTKIISLMLVLSCAGASAATAKQQRGSARFGRKQGGRG